MSGSCFDASAIVSGHRSEQAIERLELAPRIKKFSAIESKRITHSPSKANVENAGLPVESIGDRFEKLRLSGAGMRKMLEVPLLVMREPGSAKRPGEVRRRRADLRAHFGAMVGFGFHHRAGMQAGPGNTKRQITVPFVALGRRSERGPGFRGRIHGAARMFGD